MFSPTRSFLRSILRVRGPSDGTCGGGLRWARRASSLYPPSRGDNDLERRIPPGIYAPPHRPVAIDPRLLDGSQNQVIADFKSATSSENALAIRPDFGKEGKEITLRTNYFRMNIPNGPFYQYEIRTTPAVSSKWTRSRIFELAESTAVWKEHLEGLVAHDHARKLVSSTMLPQPLSIDIPYYNEGEDPHMEGSQARRTYNLTIKFDRELEIESLKKFIAGDPQYRSYDTTPIISALNLILAAWPTRSGGGGITVGRNKFFTPSTSSPIRLGGGLEAFRGFYSSVRTVHNALVVNVDVCMTPFYEFGNLADVLRNQLVKKYRLPAFVNGLNIRTTHLGHRKTIRRMSRYTAKTYVFNYAEFGDISVEEYIFRRYGIKLRYPDLQLAELAGANVAYLPAELCEIMHYQPYVGTPSDEQIETMLRHTRHSNSIAHAIENEGFQQLGFSQNVPILNAFGISISPEMVTIPGRVLTHPTIKVAGERDCRSFNREIANWNFKGEKFLKGATLQDWTVLLIRDGHRGEYGGTSDPRLRQILEEFTDTCGQHGLKISSRPTITELFLPPRYQSDPGREKAISLIRNVLPDMFQKKPPFVFAILSNNDNHIFSELKHVFDVTLGIPNVAVLNKAFWFGRSRYYSSNLGLKVNMKLGGINHVLDETSMSWLNEAPTMLVGVDVTHPGVSSVIKTPSIAAVVASVDRDYVQFPASLRMQESKKEIVTGLKDMMIERLKAFHAKSNEYPERIIVYRDGISEGQHSAVVQEELPAIREACNEISLEYRPKLTIITCVKRHHTRFFATSDEDTNEKFFLLPGTVVDQGVTPAPHFDFFLQANGSFVHAIHPTHYFVIHDENGFTSDGLQILTNNTSYLCSRTTKAIGIAVPAYYADLACERGRCYLHDMLRSTSKVVSAGEANVWDRAVQCWGNGPTGEAMKDVMFYL